MRRCQIVLFQYFLSFSVVWFYHEMCLSPCQRKAAKKPENRERERCVRISLCTLCTQRENQTNAQLPWFTGSSNKDKHSLIFQPEDGGGNGECPTSHVKTPECHNFWGRRAAGISAEPNNLGLFWFSVKNCTWKFWHFFKIFYSFLLASSGNTVKSQ